MRSKISMMMLAAAAGVGLGATSAMADYTFPTYNPSSYNPSSQGWVGTTWNNIDLVTFNGGSVPVDTYIGYNVVYNWTKLPGVGGGTYQYNSEASMAFTSAPVTGSSSTLTGGGTLYTAQQNVSTAAAPGAGGSYPYSAAVSSATTKTNNQFYGGFSTNYAGGTDPLYFNFRQRFDSTGSGQNASWSNISITLRTSLTTPTPPPATPPTVDYDFGALPGSFPNVVMSPDIALDGASKKVAWFKFTAASAMAAHDIFSMGSTILGSLGGVGDTVMGLYNSTGGLVGSNDDYSYPAAPWSRIGVGTGSGHDPDGDGPLSAFGSGSLSSLAAGDYYVALTGYASGYSFGPGFDVTGTNTNAGTVKLNIVPTPSTMALLGLGGLVATRRRRR